MSAVLRFANVAKRSGAGEVYAVARLELDARDLGRLLLHLRRVDPDGRLPLQDRRRLAVELVDAAVSDREVLDQTGISRTTLWRMRRDLVQQPNRPGKFALQSGESVSNRPSPTRRSSGPILHLEASSANGDCRALGRLLGDAR
jgi:Trp operon repressor